MEADERNRSMIDWLIRAGFLKSSNIINAFVSTPRHLFVPRGQSTYAYENIALSTVDDSTISQPSTVAYMLEMLAPARGDKVLEIGTGSGWEACLLSRCVGTSGSVVTVEIDRRVAEFARDNIHDAGTKNVRQIVADGSMGYPALAPYDRIIYTAAAPKVPTGVFKQLEVNGYLVAPVGNTEMQKVKRFRIIKGKMYEEGDDFFVFVPLRGKGGFRSSMSSGRP